MRVIACTIPSNFWPCSLMNHEQTRPRRPTMRPYSVMRMFEIMVVVVIEEMVGDSFNPYFTESMTIGSFL